MNMEPPTEIEIASLLNDENMLPKGREILRRLASQRDLLLDLTKGWNGYCWKDGEYIDDVQEYFDSDGTRTEQR